MKGLASNELRLPKLIPTARLLEVFGNEEYRADKTYRQAWQDALGDNNERFKIRSHLLVLAGVIPKLPY